MKVFIVLSAVAACAFAKPAILHGFTGLPGLPLAYAAVGTPVAVAAPVAVSSQFHAQDELGQYNYGYSSGLASKVESKSLDGVTRGGYSYVDAEGKVQNVQYTADAVHGFRVAATNLPVAPVVPKPVEVELPKPVVDTPEVAAAKIKHLEAVDEAKVRASLAPVEVVAPVAAPLVGAPVLKYAAAPAAFSYGYTAPVAQYAHYASNVVGAPIAYSAGPVAYAAAPVAYPHGYAYTVPSLVNVVPKVEEVKEVVKA